MKEIFLMNKQDAG